MIKGILLDMDGTLMDSEKYYMEYVFKILKKYNCTKDYKLAYSIIGTTTKGTYEILSELLDYRISAQDLNDECSKYYEDNPASINEYVFDNVRNTLMEFKQQGILLAICSSSPMKDIDRFINELQLNEYIDYKITGDDLKESKPNPEIYLTALNKLGLNKEEVIIYEDSYSGILAGNNALIYTIAREELRFNIDQSNADKIVKDIIELKEYISGENQWKK